MTHTLADVHAAFNQWLALQNCDVVDVALATVQANRMAGDPLWVFLVAPPSGGKTEGIRSLDDVPDVFALSSLTAQTFASGFERKGGETSLLPKVDGKTITMKDFGTILTMHRDKRGEILAQLREVYDGSYVKQWGNGKAFRWDGKVGLLAGVTPIIDQHYAVNQVLGERFLLYRVKAAPARELARRAIAQREREADQRRALRVIVADFMETLPLIPAPLPAPISEALAAVAEFTALGRSPVLFDARGEIEYVPAPEGPGRLAKQLVLLAQALGVVRAEPEVSIDTYLTVFQAAQDTMPAQRRVMLEAVLTQSPKSSTAEPPTTTEIAEITRYPTQTARRYLQELVALRLLDRLPGGPGLPDRWQPATTLRDLLTAIRGPLTPTTSPVTSGGMR